MTPSELTHSAATAALELLPDGVLVVCDGEVLLANRALCRMAGEDLVGHAPPAWLPASGQAEVEVDGRPAFVTVAPCAIAGGRSGSVVTVRNADAPSVLAHRASHDGLTGVLNQRAFRERLAVEAARGETLSLVVIDLDHFKAVNDVHGHPVGDRVLAEAAARIAGAARAVDVVGRIGGEEFAWLLPGDAAAAALVAAQRLRAALRSSPLAGVEVTASMGVCDLRTAHDADALLRRADEALYWAKAFGRDCALVWSARTAARIASVRDGSAPDDAHGTRVAALAVALAEARGWEADAAARLHHAGRLHDLGKLALPDSLLERAGALSEPELEHIRQHARIGAELAGLDEEPSSWIRHHHERWDGVGYPARLSGDGIPEGAQLLAIADAWDTLVSGRPYRGPLSADEALAEIDCSAGTHLRPDAGALLRAALAWLS
ncbi:diguanylate cyclase [Solirubrobacter taibaiensis]|nr:diguanylate cyclase [Solirubrobacter taibaiensis]